MINRWGTAVLALGIFATPVAAQPSIENTEPVEESPALPGKDMPAPAIPSDEADAADSATTDDATIDGDAAPDGDETFEDFSIEPTVDVTELRATVAETLPTAAPPPPTITNILPANTPAAMIVNTQQEAWEVLNQYALFAQLSESFGVPPSPQSLPLLPWGMDYAEDVEPWIGDSVAFALLPVPSIRTINPVERSLTIVPINDAAAFIDFIPKLAEVRAALPEQTAYRTFPIWHWAPEFVPYDYPWNDVPEADIELQESPEVPPPSGTPSDGLNSYRRDPDLPYIYIPDGNYSDEGYTLPGYAVAHLGNYIIMAENIDSVRQWIEYQTQGGPKLTSNPSFAKTQSHPESQNSLATVYGNVGQLLNFEFSNPFQNFGLPPIPQPSLSDRAAMSNLLSNVTFDILVYPETKGMHLEAHLYTEGALPDLPPSPNADHSILGLIPAATYVMGSGYDISGFWNDVSSAFSLNDVSGGLIETARSIVALATGLDLDTDILGWMDGEYSLFLFPSQSGFLNSFFPGLGLEAGVILETSNRPAAEAALEALDNVIGEEAVVPATIANASVVNWQYDVNLDGTMDSVLTHTWITDDTLAFTSGKGAMERLVVPAGFNPLDGHSTFRNATANFPNPNNGYFYVNMGSTLSFFYNLFGFNQATDPWATDIRSYFGTVRSLSVTTSSSTQEFQLDALLGLAASEPIAAEVEEIDPEEIDPEETDAEDSLDMGSQ